MRLLFEVLICLVKKDFFKLLGAATIQRRLLFEGGHYWRLYGIRNFSFRGPYPGKAIIFILLVNPEMGRSGPPTWAGPRTKMFYPVDPTQEWVKPAKFCQNPLF